MFNTSVVFQANFESTADICINQGGTDSTKTYSIMQLLCVIACRTDAPVVDPIITVLNESVPNSKKGGYRIFQSLYSSTEEIRDNVVNWNSGERLVTFRTGWKIEFVGATDEQNAKQGKRQYLFANEANGISYPIFWQYAKRTRVRVYLDYNPSAPFWAHEKLIGTTKEGNDLFATVQLIISDHRHNPFITEKDHAKTENIKDPELHAVYARGKTGNLTGLIYPLWKQIPMDKFPWDDVAFGGLDFGYTNDPTAGVICARIANKIYVHEICYSNEMTATQLAVLFKSYKFNEETPIYCEHDAEMIRQLRLKGVMSIAARKGQGSIKAGISKVKEYEVFYTDSSKNIQMEKQKYMWIKDKITNKFLNIASDADNHLMDAIRYAIYTHYYRAE